MQKDLRKQKEMLIRQNKMLLLWIVLVVSSFSGSSSNTVVTYTTKNVEEMQCPIDANTLAATWNDDTTVNALYTYRSNSDEIDNRDLQPKHNNFNYSYVPNTHFNLIIYNVEGDDEGTYSCEELGDASTDTVYEVTVEVLAKPTVQYESQDVDALNVIVGTSYDLTCSAAGARSESDLSLVWDPSLVVKTPLDITPSTGNYKDYSITSTYTAVRAISSITCQLSGYLMQDEIKDQRMENISHTVNLNVRYAPICNMTLKEREDCRNVTLTCKCEAVPADITQYSFFDGTSEIYDETNNTFTLSVAYGTLSSFSCSASNSIGPGEKSDVKVHDCDKATESTTEEPKPTPTKKQGGLTTGAKIGISLGAVAVVVVIVVVAVILWKNGEDDSKPSDDKLDDNGAGPRGDPEIPAYGVVDKNRTKDPTPAPRSSMRDSKNPSNPKQDGPMEMQYADLDHGNKPASDEVRKPKEEPTEYATVQSVIV